MQLNTLSHSRAASGVNLNPLDIEVCGYLQGRDGARVGQPLQVWGQGRAHQQMGSGAANKHVQSPSLFSFTFTTEEIYRSRPLNLITKPETGFGEALT